MALMPWMLIANAASLAVNLALGLAWLHQREELAAQAQLCQSQTQRLEEQRQHALDAAELCSSQVQRLAAQAKRRAAEAATARAIAAQQAAAHNQRADAVLSTPAAVPGDDCASAEVRAAQWIRARKEGRP